MSAGILLDRPKTEEELTVENDDDEGVEEEVEVRNNDDEAKEPSRSKGRRTRYLQKIHGSAWR